LTSCDDDAAEPATSHKQQATQQAEPATQQKSDRSQQLSTAGRGKIKIFTKYTYMVYGIPAVVYHHIHILIF
jgi:hypothetical protein